jgi:phage-related protein
MIRVFPEIMVRILNIKLENKRKKNIMNFLKNIWNKIKSWFLNAETTIDSGVNKVEQVPNTVKTDAEKAVTAVESTATKVAQDIQQGL